MKKCEQCGGRFEPRRTTARYCSVLCRHRAYRQRARSEQPRHRLERALLTAIRELRSGRTVEAVMTARLAIDDYDHAAAKRKKRPAKSAAKPKEATAKGAVRGRRKPPPLPKQRPATKSKTSPVSKVRGKKPPVPKKSTAAKRKTAAASKTGAKKPPPPKRATPRRGKAAAARARAAAPAKATNRPARAARAASAQVPPPGTHDPAEATAELLVRYEQVLDSGVVQQAELARQLGLHDGTTLSRWRHGGSLAQDHADDLARLLDEYEWEIFAGDTLN